MRPPIDHSTARRSVLLALASSAALPQLPRAATADLAELGRLRQDIGQSVKGDGVQILLSDLSYRELSSCPAQFYLPPKGSWNCIEISATATNQGNRDVSAAAVFGLVRDAEGYACMATALDESMKSGIASLGAVPMGQSRHTFVVAVQSRSPRPLRLAGFKASFRSAAIERTFQPFDPCEVDSSQCDDDELDKYSNAKTAGPGLFGAQY